MKNLVFCKDEWFQSFYDYSTALPETIAILAERYVAVLR